MYGDVKRFMSYFEELYKEHFENLNSKEEVENKIEEIVYCSQALNNDFIANCDNLKFYIWNKKGWN